MRFIPTRLLCVGSAIVAAVGFVLACSSDDATGNTTPDGGIGVVRDTGARDADASSFGTPTQVVAGDDFSCVLTSAGAVYCWGGGPNQAGEIGSDEPSLIPVMVAGLPQITQIAASNAAYTVCAIDVATNVWCWGDNANGELGIGVVDMDSHPTPTKVISPDGTGDLSGAKSIVSAVGEACATVADGSLYCWGFEDRCDDEAGVTSDAGAGICDAPSPTENFPTPNLTPGIAAQQVTIGFGAVCAIGVLQGDTVASASCWGQNESQLGSDLTHFAYEIPQRVPIPGSPVMTGVAAGIAHVCALDSSGDVYCWGQSDAESIGTADGGATIDPVKVDGFANSTAIAAGELTTCASFQDGSVACIGGNLHGELGTGASVQDTATPTAVPGLTSVTSLAVGSTHVCAIGRMAGDEQSSVFCWGANEAGELGDGTTNNASTPVRVVAPAD